MPSEKRRKYLEENKERIAAKASEYYYKHKKRINKLQRIWRNKNKEYIAKEMKEWRKNNAEKIKHSGKKWALLNKDKIRKASKKIRKSADIEQLRAYERNRSKLRRLNDDKGIKIRRIVSNALRDKKLEKAPCVVCGHKKVEAHHSDYTQPLNITWLCKSHHDAWHRVFLANK